MYSLKSQLKFCEKLPWWQKVIFNLYILNLYDFIDKEKKYYDKNYCN